MWLINTTSYQLRPFNGPENVPPYAILSHTWGPDEVTLQDIQQNTGRTKAGFSKILGTCHQAIRHEIDWAWIDSCCIDKTSSAELSEAINSMYSYYLRSRVCFVYLSDVPPLSASSQAMAEMPSLARSRWFTRGWTLQELIAPRRSIFYALDWSRIGTKGLHRGEQPFIGTLAAITGVFESVLAQTRSPRDYSVAERMSWAAARQTTRPEDLAYCVMGLFGVNIPVLYGEGLTHAFRRLQHEIIRTSPDETIFAWRADPAQEVMDPHTGERRRRAVCSSSLLAASPADFARSHDVHQRALHSATPFRLFSMTNMGLSIGAELIPLATPSNPRGSPQPETAKSLVVLPIGASDRPTNTGSRARVGLYLEPVLPAPSPSTSSLLPRSGSPSLSLSSASYTQVFYRRVKCDDFCFAPSATGGEFSIGDKTEIFILDDDQFAEMRWADRPSSAGGGSPSIGGRLWLSPSASPRDSPRLGGAESA